MSKIKNIIMSKIKNIIIDIFDFDIFRNYRNCKNKK